MAKNILNITFVIMFLISGISAIYATNKAHSYVDPVNDDRLSAAGKPDGYKLYQNFPNPFNPVTKISYKINYEGAVILKVYNLVGQVVRVLVDETQKPGKYEVEFDASDLSSGVYLYKLEINDYISVKRMTLLK